MANKVKTPYVGNRIVHCRACKGEIDKEVMVLNEDYIRIEPSAYYHKDCYERRSGKMSLTATYEDQVWFDALWDFLLREAKIGPKFAKVQAQWQSFMKKKMTAKGMYYTARYLYSIKHLPVDKIISWFCIFR